MIDKIPNTESLKDTYERTIPYYKKNIENLLVQEKNIIVVAHGNSIRALCKYLLEVSDNKISELEIPTGNPLMINLNKKLKINSCYYLDDKRKKNLLLNI